MIEKGKKLHKIEKESKKEKESRGKAQQKKGREQQKKTHKEKRKKLFSLVSLSRERGEPLSFFFFFFDRYTGAPGMNAKACRSVER
jgi:hypothetical protein